MDLPRFYCTEIKDSFFELPDPEAHHLASVLRLKPGQKVELFDGAGTLGVARITDIAPHKVSLRIENSYIFPKPHPKQIIIAASIAKHERFDWLISKCTELGADRICPVLFERTVKQSKNPKALQRWQNLSIAAAKQCRRIFLPKIDSPSPLQEVLKLLKEDFPKARFFFGSLDEKIPSLIDLPFSNSDMIALIGPEGGLTEDELTLLKSYNAQPVRLTDTILRVETAAITFTAILSTKRNAKKIKNHSD